MTKRILSILLLVSLMISSVALAETVEFTFAGNLRFGMSYDEALLVSGFNAYEESKGSIHWNRKELMGIQNQKYIGSIDDYEISGLTFHAGAQFDSANKLFRVQYTIGGVLANEYKADDFNKLETILTNTYGPESYTCTSPIPAYLDDLYSGSTIVYAMTAQDIPLNYSIRAVPYAGGTVVIENVIYQTLTTFNNALTGKYSHNNQQFHHLLIYTYYDVDLTPTDADSLRF
ncbi:MAG: hypothetical protein IJZ74_01905 [Clostridia bacterium]|nr:hypothetical protein [Clostridia bacterium]